MSNKQPTNFVAPAPYNAERAAGYRAFCDGEGIDPAWTDAKRRGWLRALRDCAAALTSEYLVGMGVSA